MLHQQLLEIGSQGPLLVDLQLYLGHVLLHLPDGGPQLAQCWGHILVFKACFTVCVLVEKRKSNREQNMLVLCVRDRMRGSVWFNGNVQNMTVYGYNNMFRRKI